MSQVWVDTHCHLHDSEFYPENREEAYEESRQAGAKMVVVGTDVRSSIEALQFAVSHDSVYPIIGVHPHEAVHGGGDQIRRLAVESRGQIVGIGEIGLDYFYDHSSRDDQIRLLEEQLQIAADLDLPVSCHVRSGFDDFWPIFDSFHGIRGVLHSFTDNQANLEQALSRGLFIGVNGISTFTRDPEQQRLFRELPLEYILLETDAPFLTPKPFRGTMNIPAYVRLVGEWQATEKNISVTEVARVTASNAKTLFGVK